MPIREIRGVRHHPPTPYSIQTIDLSFVPGKKSGSTNAVLAGHRYCRDRKRSNKEYWKCTYFKDGCRARITTEDQQPMTLTLPSHFHDVQHSEILVHVTKPFFSRGKPSCPTPLLGMWSWIQLGTLEMKRLPSWAASHPP